MLNPIEINFKLDKTIKRAHSTEVMIKSHDVNVIEFHISFDGLELTADHTVKVLSVFNDTKSQTNVNCDIVDGKAIYRPDTSIISQYEHVLNYVYVYHGEQVLDVREFLYSVSLSRIDETALKVKEVYDQSYADLLADFEARLQDYKESLPQASDLRAEVDVILDKFKVDSDAKLSQYDADAQQVIADNQTAFGLAESGRQDSYEQAEDSRNQASEQAVADWNMTADLLLGTVEANESARVDAEATRKSSETMRVSNENERESAEDTRQANELLREENYNQKVDTAIVEADVVEKVDNKVTELTPQINNLTAQLAQTSSKITAFPLQKKLLEKMSGSLRKVNFPSGWEWTNAPINIFKDFNGGVFTDFEASDFKPHLTGTTYHVAINGSDSNDGLTPDKPFRKIMTAMNMPDRAKIIVGGGVYDRLNGFGGSALTKNVIIENKLGERPIISAHDHLNWTKTSGMSNVYQANRSAVWDVYDAKFINKYGDYKELEKKSSISEVDQSSGSWYTDGAIIYVHTENSREPDAYIRAMMNTNNGRYVGGGTVYLEGIAFEGGGAAFRVENTESGLDTRLVAKNCKFKYAQRQNNLHVLGAEVYLQNCEGAEAMQDGFNYHVNNGVRCKVIEVDCISRHNGRDGANQNNGSTNHDGGYAIRVNGEYHHNYGPNVIDVNEGSQTWNIGVSAHESVADSGISNSDFKNGNVGKSEMWLDSCVSFGSEYSLVTQGEGSVSYENNNVFTEETFNDNGTLIESYTPVLSSIPLTYTEIRELRLIERRNYDSRTGTGWVEVTKTAHYTTGIGDTMTLEFEGTGVDFIAPLNQRGGIWEFRVDNNDPVIVSVHENVTEDKEFIAGVSYRVEIERGLSEGRHTLVATFKGADPDNPPSSGDARGYVTFNPGSVTYSTFDVYGY